MAIAFEPALAREVDAGTLEAHQQRAPRGFSTSADFRTQWMLKHPHLSEFHSRAEHLHAGLLEGEPDVLSYVPQPFTVRVGRRRYTPDCYVVRATGRPCVVEIKPGGLMDESLRMRVQAYFELQGLAFEVIANEAMLARRVEAENWLEIVRILRIGADETTTDAEYRVLDRLMLEGPCKLGDLVDPGDRERTYLLEVALFRLLHRGIVSAPLHERPLDFDTLFALRNDPVPAGAGTPAAQAPRQAPPPDAIHNRTAPGLSGSSPAHKERAAAPLVLPLPLRKPVPEALVDEAPVVALSWRERLEQRPDLRSIDEWPVIPAEELKPEQSKAYQRNQRIVARALSGHPFRDIASDLGVTPARISQLLQRCLGGSSSDPPALTRGLIPFAAVATRARQSPLPTLANENRANCAFSGLLERLPELREGMDAMIEASFKDQPHSQRLRPGIVYAEFRRILAHHHWPRDCYPYTEKSCARESVRRYFHERCDALERERLQRRSRRAMLRPRYEGDWRAMHKTQLDEHTIDLHTRVDLVIDDQPTAVRVSRPTLLVAVDVETTCVLGYYLAPTGSANQQDLLTLFERCVRPAPLPTLNHPQLAYSAGAAFPCTLDCAAPVSFGEIALDNAYVHLAESVTDLCTNSFAATLHRGLPATPTARWLVESLFRYIAKHLTHRPASTAGSHPRDPKRESKKNKKNLPVISLQTLDEALAVVVTDYNTRPTATLRGHSPLDVYREHCAHHYVRYIPAARRRQWQPLIDSSECAVHWPRDDARRPHINFFYARYQGAGLDAVAGQVKKIRVRYDRRDIRTLHASTLEGDDLGELLVCARWQRYPHSLATRQYIHKNAREWSTDPNDALGPFFRHLLENKHDPASALFAVRLGQEFRGGNTTTEIMAAQDSDVPATPPKTVTRRWNRQRAAHRDP